MQKAIFSCGDNTTFTGYDNGQRWNGWATPLFTLTEAMNVINHFNEVQKKYANDCPYDQFEYIESEDAIKTLTYEDGKVVNEHTDKAITIDGIKYYDIANCDYCWEKH